MLIFLGQLNEMLGETVGARRGLIPSTKKAGPTSRRQANPESCSTQPEMKRSLAFGSEGSLLRETCGVLRSARPGRTREDEGHRIEERGKEEDEG